MHPPLQCVLSGVTLAAVVALAAPWSPATAHEPEQPPAADPLFRPLTHVTTDKPIYRPGERVFLRGVLLDAVTNTPLPARTPAHAMVEIKGPKGDTLLTSWTNIQSSTLGFAWEVPAGQPGGEYTARISYPSNGFAPAERRFEIRAYRAPRLKSQIVFLREGYGPGDTVAATTHVDRAEGGVPDGARVTVVARVDGQEVHRGATTIDAEGNCRVEFELPGDLGGGEGSLSLVIEDGGVVETAAKTIPILLSRVDVSTYPEGGDLVASVPNRVYFEARRPDGKPADIAGTVVDDTGAAVSTFRSEHEGRGRFVFTPRPDRRYTLRITEPAGITESIDLPEVRAEGVVITSMRDTIPAGDGVRLSILSPTKRRVRLTISKKDLEVASAIVTLAPRKPTELFLHPDTAVDGVLVVTVWDLDDAPLAERLVYRAPESLVHIEIQASRPSYVPGDEVELVVRTIDDDGKPVSATVGLTVTDDSILEMIETREHAPRLPVMVALEGDVRELADARIYLNQDDPDAPRALDLLLATQGWRRFAFVDAGAFVAANGDAGRRVVAWLDPAAQFVNATFVGGGRGGGGDVRFPWGSVVRRAGVDGFVPKEALPQAPPVNGKAPMDLVVADLDESDFRELAEDVDKLVQVGRLELRKSKAIRDDLKDWRRGQLMAGQIAVREYAHTVRPDREPGSRIDFTETLYFNAGVTTDASTGEATLRFGLSDLVTSFRVLADAFTAGGALGEGTTLIESVEPFYVEPKMPLEVTAGDIVILPIAVVNATGDRLVETVVTLSIPDGAGTTLLDAITLDPQARERLLHSFDTAGLTGVHDVIITAQGGVYADTVTRPLVVQPRGFPIELTWGGVIEPGKSYRHEFVIPAQLASGSLTTTAVLYPTPLANLTDALQRLLREPSGCFEQTSSTTYPLVMAQQYFLSHQGIDPAIIERSRGLLSRGYEKLIGFQTTDHGYEWFGQDPGHEALSAYGLLEFSDMAAVREVDPSMLAAIRAFLLETRDGKGGFERGRRALHTWITDPDCSNGYILFSLLSCGGPDEAIELEREIANFEDSATASENAYVTALAANVMTLAGRGGSARRFMDRLAKGQAAEGFVDGATTSIVGSGGDALRIETTALAVLAWLGDPSYAGSVESAMRWLAETCKSGRFGSTQSTVLALRAIVEYDKNRSRPKRAGSVFVYVDDEPVDLPVTFGTDSPGAIELPGFTALLTPGRHTVDFRMSDGSAMPYSLTIGYHTDTPPSDDGCALDVDVSLRDTEISEGLITEAAVIVTNRSSEPVPSPIAIVGIPGGLEVRHDHLRELVDAGTIASYEVIGREVVLYWRSLDAGRRVELALSLVAAVPGRYTGPASRAYLYYTDELKSWDAGLEVSIDARRVTR